MIVRRLVEHRPRHLPHPLDLGKTMLDPRIKIGVVEIHIREPPQIRVIARRAQRLAMPLFQRFKSDKCVFEHGRFDCHARALSRGRMRG